MKKSESNLSENEIFCTLDDIIFQHKNHEYGAYQLRKNYLKTINRAFLIGTSVFVFGLAVPTIYASFNPKSKSVEVTLKPVSQLPDAPKEEIVLPKPPPVEEIPEVATTRFLPPVLVNTVDPEEETPPTQTEMKESKPGETTVIADPSNLDPVIDETEKRVEPVEIKPEEPEIFTVLEQQASFPGGLTALGKYLQHHLNYPPPAQRANISGKVFLSFVVDKEGNISDVSVTKGIGFGCDEEAVRVIKGMPKWSPGKQSGRAVKSRFSLPIAFVLD
jgi:periplasmic protein TonB